MVSRYDGRTRLLVVVTPGPVAGADVTRRSLALQTGVNCQLTSPDGDSPAMLNAAVAASDASFVTFVQDGDVLCPGALRLMCDAIAACPPEVEAIEALALPIDGIDTTRETGHARAAGILAGARAADAALLTFRREALVARPLEGRSVADALRQAVNTLGGRGGVNRLGRIVCARPAHTSRRAPHVALAGRIRQVMPILRYALRHASRLANSASLTGALGRWRRPYSVLAALFRRWPDQGLAMKPRDTDAQAPERIAYVLWRYPFFTETFIRREVHALRGAGIDPVVFALEPDDPPVPDDPASPAGPVEYFGPVNEAAGRASIRVHFRRHPWTVVRLCRFVVAHQLNGDASWWRDRNVLYLGGQLASTLEARGITHVHAPWANQYAVVAFIAARLIGATFSAQARASEMHRTVQTPFVADRLKFTTFVVTNSHYNERALRARLAPVGAPQVHVIYNGLDLSLFHPGTRSEHAGCRLLSIGRLVEPKGFGHLLHACARLRDRGVEFSCEIIGGPSEPGDTAAWVELRILLTALGLESIVRFRGAQSFSSVLRAFERADIFVLPCVRGRDGAHDITPNSLIEAMAMALPVVSTTSGAIPEIVDHDVDGLLVPPGDVEALTEALARLAGDAGLRASLGNAARAKVEDRFDSGKNVARRVELFRLLRTTPGGQPSHAEVEQSSTCRTNTSL